MHDLIIIGAGPAGLTSAIYARRAGKSVLLLEALSYGGQIINTPDIENYPAESHISGFELATKMFDQATALGAETLFKKAVGIEDRGDFKEVMTEDGSFTARAVIIATGSRSKSLGLPLEKELTGRGVSYCATCDGAFFRKKTVAVVGGGNTALKDALYLSGLAEKVYLIHRRDAFRGDEVRLARLRERPNVSFILRSVVTRLYENGGMLSAIELEDADGKSSELPVNGLFVAVGREPENGAFAGLLELDEAGYAEAGENCRTKTPGVFVAGDNRKKDVRQLVTATADGAVAATEAVKYLSSLGK